jgi:hypothetical protein
VLHLLVDTSTWLDLSKRRDGQRWIVAIRTLVHQGEIELLVPEVIVDEFERNRDRVETSMTSTVAQRFTLMKQDLGDYGGSDYEQALEVIEGLAHEVPLIGAMTTRNFNEVLELLKKGRQLFPTDVDRNNVVQRGLDKRAPFHRSRNSVADALLIEMYASALDALNVTTDPHSFVTSNSDDFSLANGDKREPHEDIADLFADDGSSYGLGVDGLNAILLDQFGGEIEQLFEETYFEDQPRKLAEITSAEQEMFDRIWYHRSLQHQYKLEDEGGEPEVARLLQVSGSGRVAWKRPTQSKDSSVRTRTSNLECSTERCLLCAGCSEVNGISSTPDPRLHVN